MAIASNHAEQTAAHNRYYRATGFTSIKAFFGNYVNFKGRSSRSEYWGPALLIAGVLSVVGTTLIVSLIGSIGDPMNDLNLSQLFHGVAGLLTILLLVVIALPSTALIIRRSRDAGVPWWCYLVILGLNLASFFIPSASLLTDVASLTIVSLTLLLILALKPSRPLPPATLAPATGTTSGRGHPDHPYIQY
ncbi:DUF805 domain-containing protein [Lacticaseibacillus jixianensis]|uniref:DUF805 domain-containing protein n=1 Tax=Lacticaseibacillus jixianensis TaxID=2486012 RepID=A0ABW4B8X0_9LACO|nr:DUF805 domain-containing protein [Lacticaseibacillus jixianensis]